MTGVIDARRLWGGRFDGAPAPETDRLNRSLPVDCRLWEQDVAINRAWVDELGAVGVLTAEEVARLREGLDEVGARLAGWGPGDWAAAADEDVHTLVERLLAQAVGPIAGTLATGRSRNDQVATATRLWAMSAVAALDHRLADLQATLVEQAGEAVEVVMPSYTHLQRAQPVSAAHWFLSHFWPLARDRERLTDVVRRISVLPLGSGAVAGCAFPIDRLRLADALGFARVSANSMDGVADRDFVAELLFAMTLAATHLARLAEDVIVFASAEFGFLRLPDGYSTGSSLMPQKRNPDTMELARAKAGRLLGELAGWLAILKGLPSGYNKDLQEDKTALFGAFDTLEVLLPAITGTVRGLRVEREKCAAAVDPAVLATDLADALVRQGIPFRESHERVGAVVRLAEELGCPMDQIPRDRLADISGAFTRIDLADAFDAQASMARRAAPGGTAPAAVLDQLEMAKARL